MVSISSRNLSSEVKQNRIIKHNCEHAGTCKNHYQNEGPMKIYGGNAIRNKYVLSFFQKVAIVSDVFKVIFKVMGFIPDPSCSDRESMFAQVKLSLRNTKLWIRNG